MSYSCYSIDVLHDSTPHNEDLRISYVELFAFRNHPRLDFNVEGSMIMLVGPNGAGKTSILEAISLLSSGRGLHHEKLSNLQYNMSLDSPNAMTLAKPSLETIIEPILAPSPWSVGARIQRKESSYYIGTSIKDNKRIIHIDGEPKKQQELSNICSVFWLTPAMESLIRETPYAKRKFLDKIIARFDPNHARLVYKCEALQRKYNTIRTESSKHSLWNDTIIEQLTSTAIALTSSRRGFVGRFNRISLAADNALPKVTLGLYGKLASWYDEEGSQFAESKCLQHLKKELNNHPDSPNPFLYLSDKVRINHRLNSLDSGLCSSGERKSFLISIILTITRMWKADRGFAPILLLDDITSHLDKNLQQLLMQDITELETQTWLSGQEVLEVDNLNNPLAIFEVSPGTVKRVTL